MQYCTEINCTNYPQEKALLKQRLVKTIGQNGIVETIKTRFKSKCNGDIIQNDRKLKLPILRDLSQDINVMVSWNEGQQVYRVCLHLSNNIFAVEWESAKSP